MARQKFYAVWVGRIPGVYLDWESCKAQVHGHPVAEFRGYATRDQAERAWRAGSRRAAAAQELPSPQVALIAPTLAPASEHNRPPEAPTIVSRPTKGLTVDASCIGNPGETEYQGVDLATGQTVFRQSVGWGTNNIGEFLAIVHGLAILAKNDDDGPIFSDSLLAIQWVRDGKSRSTHIQNPLAVRACALIVRAETWLREQPRRTSILHWKTKLWGEIPADFGRK